jgi:hypothetical protein
MTNNQPTNQATTQPHTRAVTASPEKDTSVWHMAMHDMGATKEKIQNTILSFSSCKVPVAVTPRSNTDIIYICCSNHFSLAGRLTD